MTTFRANVLSGSVAHVHEHGCGFKVKYFSQNAQLQRHLRCRVCAMLPCMQSANALSGSIAHVHAHRIASQISDPPVESPVSVSYILGAISVGSESSWMYRSIGRRIPSDSLLHDMCITCKPSHTLLRGASVRLNSQNGRLIAHAARDCNAQISGSRAARASHPRCTSPLVYLADIIVTPSGPMKTG